MDLSAGVNHYTSERPVRTDSHCHLSALFYPSSKRAAVLNDNFPHDRVVCSRAVQGARTRPELYSLILSGRCSRVHRRLAVIPILHRTARLSHLVGPCARRGRHGDRGLHKLAKGSQITLKLVITRAGARCSISAGQPALEDTKGKLVVVTYPRRLTNISRVVQIDGDVVDNVALSSLKVTVFTATDAQKRAGEMTEYPECTAVVHSV